MRLSTSISLQRQVHSLTHRADASTAAKAAKASTSSFPSPYYFESDAASAEDKAALAKRAARFAKPASNAQSGPSSAYATPGMTDWFGQDASKGNSGIGTLGLSGKGKGKGKKGKFGIGTIGMGGDAEADAVGIPAFWSCFAE